MILSIKPNYTLTEFLSVIEGDLHLYADNGYVTEHTILPIILQCSEELGYRVHQSKQCVLMVENGRAPIPPDLWKIETMFALTTTTVSQPLNFMQGIRQSWHFGHPHNMPDELKGKVTYLGFVRQTGDNTSCTNCGTPDCTDNNCAPIHISKYNPYYFPDIEKKYIIPLKLSPSVNTKCALYSPCSKWNGNYSVTIVDQEFDFTFDNGQVFLSYLGALVNEEGETLIPSHPRLFPFYRWSVVTKIMEDLLFNSEANVSDKLQYADRKRTGAKYDAFNFILSPSEKQIENQQKILQQEYYNKWYKMFE